MYILSRSVGIQYGKIQQSTVNRNRLQKRKRETTNFDSSIARKNKSIYIDVRVGASVMS